MANREQRRSPLVTNMLRKLGIEEDAIEAAWPQVLTACTTVLQKARMQGVVNNGHLMAFGGSLIVDTLSHAPESDRARMFDDYVADLRKEIVPEPATSQSCLECGFGQGAHFHTCSRNKIVP